MTDLIRKSFSKPDDVLRYPNVTIESVRVGDLDVMRLTAEPGWRWSESVGPTVDRSACPVEHTLWLVLEGRFGVRMDDGTGAEFGPGEVGRIGPGHDAWVVGDARVVGIDVRSASHQQTPS